jgi:hypothetical protein
LTISLPSYEWSCDNVLDLRIVKDGIWHACRSSRQRQLVQPIDHYSHIRASFWGLNDLAS